MIVQLKWKMLKCKLERIILIMMVRRGNMISLLCYIILDFFCIILCNLYDNNCIEKTINKLVASNKL